MEKKQLKLRAKFELDTDITWTNSQGEPDIDYVYWLEQKVIELEKEIAFGEEEHERLIREAQADTHPNP